MPIAPLSIPRNNTNGMFADDGSISRPWSQQPPSFQPQPSPGGSFPAQGDVYNKPPFAGSESDPYPLPDDNISGAFNPALPDTRGDKRLRPDLITPVTAPTGIKDARTLLSYLKGQGADVSKGKADTLDPNSTAHFDTDQSTGDKIKQLMRGVEETHKGTGAQSGYLRLADGRTSVFFSPAEEKSTRQTASEFLDSLQDPGERAVYTQTLNENLQKLKAGQAQLTNFSAETQSARDESSRLQSQADDLLREARNLTRNQPLGNGPQADAQRLYTQRQADKLTAQAEELKGQAEQKKITAKEFLARQKGMQEQLDQFGKAAPENAMAAVDEQRAKQQQRREDMEFQSNLIKSRQPDQAPRNIKNYQTLRDSSFANMNKQFEIAKTAATASTPFVPDEKKPDQGLGDRNKAIRAKAAQDKDYKVFMAQFHRANERLNDALGIADDDAIKLRNDLMAKLSKPPYNADLNDPAVLAKIEESIRKKLAPEQAQTNGNSSQ